MRIPAAIAVGIILFAQLVQYDWSVSVAATVVLVWGSTLFLGGKARTIKIALFRGHLIGVQRKDYWSDACVLSWAVLGGAVFFWLPNRISLQLFPLFCIGTTLFYAAGKVGCMSAGCCLSIPPSRIPLPASELGACVIAGATALYMMRAGMAQQAALLALGVYGLVRLGSLVARRQISWRSTLDIWITIASAPIIFSRAM